MPEDSFVPVVVLAKSRRFASIVTGMAGQMRLILCPTPMALLGAASIERPRLVVLEAEPGTPETRQLVESLRGLCDDSPPRILLVVRPCDVPTHRRALMAGVDTTVCDPLSADRLCGVITCLLRANTPEECNQCGVWNGAIRWVRETAKRLGLERCRFN